MHDQIDSRLPAGVVVFERGWLSSNNVLCLGSTCNALVDTGYASHAAQTEALVKRALGGRTLDVLVNTHLHSDHCGGNAQLQAAFPRLQTWIPPGLATAVRDWDLDALTYVPTGQSCPQFQFNDVVLPGSSVLLGDSYWEVHAAPGHDTHAILLFEPDTKTLISADALWETGFGVVFPELEGESAFDEVGTTLDLIESLSPKAVIPGHGKVFHDVGRALDTARGRLARLREDPANHAQHAGKVLIKFKLLELQQLSEPDLLAWTQQTPYFNTIHGRFFQQQSLEAWVTGLVESLIQSHAARRDGALLVNG